MIILIQAKGFKDNSSYLVCDKMGWKKLPSWLKGGIILSVLYLIISLILIKYPCSTGYLRGQCLGLGILFLVLSSPGLGILNLLSIEYSENLYLAIIFTFSIYFIIGAIIGWIIGKIKSRKRENEKRK